MYNRAVFESGMSEFLKKNGRTMRPAVKESLIFLIGKFENDPRWKDDRHVAYAFATFCVETDWTFAPIQEYGGKSYFERRYGYLTSKGKELGNKLPGDGAAFSGKGHVQVTGRNNYEKATKKLASQYPDLAVDLGKNPEKMKDPEISFAVTTMGMHEGWFTGRKLSNYLNDDTTNFREARRIINGLDRADEIKSYAEQILKVLRESKNV